MRTFKQALGLMPRFRTANLKDLSHWRPQCSVEWLILMTSIFFALACNGLFWSSALGVQSSLRMGTCRIPDDYISKNRYPLFMARAVMRGLIESLQSLPEGSPC